MIPIIMENFNLNHGFLIQWDNHCPSLIIILDEHNPKQCGGDEDKTQKRMLKVYSHCKYALKLSSNYNLIETDRSTFINDDDDPKK